MKLIAVALALLGLASAAHAQPNTSMIEANRSKIMDFAQKASAWTHVPPPSAVLMAEESDTQLARRIGFSEPPYMQRSYTEDGKSTWSLLVDDAFLRGSDDAQFMAVAYFMCAISTMTHKPPDVVLTKEAMQQGATLCTFDVVGEAVFANYILNEGATKPAFAGFRGLQRADVIAKLRENFAPKN